MDRDRRHKMILDAIVSMYIQNGEPIASQALQDALGISVSSATLRNEMAALTKQGYLNQPHISAGRVPTNKAYRYYVQNLDRSAQIAPADKREIKSRFDKLDADSRKFYPGAAKLFSRVLGYSVAIEPPIDDELQFVNFTAVKNGRYSIVLVGTTSRGEVYTRVVRVTGEINPRQLSQLSAVINSRLCFTCYADLDRGYFARLIKQLEYENVAFAQMLQGALALIEDANSRTVYVAGQEKLLDTGRFDENIGDVLKLLADTDMLRRIITPRDEGITVVYGDEIPIRNIENTCFISTKYYAGSAVSGTLAVICPQTVDYQRLFLAMEYFAQLLSQSVTGIERS